MFPQEHTHTHTHTHTPLTSHTQPFLLSLSLSLFNCANCSHIDNSFVLFLLLCSWTRSGSRSTKRIATRERARQRTFGWSRTQRRSSSVVGSLAGSRAASLAGVRNTCMTLAHDATADVPFTLMLAVAIKSLHLFFASLVGYRAASSAGVRSYCMNTCP